MKIPIEDNDMSEAERKKALISNLLAKAILGDREAGKQLYELSK